MNTQKQHYIAMSGMHGCLPDHCEVYETLEDAVSDLANVFDLGRTRQARLKADKYLELTPTPIEQAQEMDFGAEYCEIQVCTCADPSTHSDSQ